MERTRQDEILAFYEGQKGRKWNDAHIVDFTSGKMAARG